MDPANGASLPPEPRGRHQGAAKQERSDSDEPPERNDRGRAVTGQANAGSGASRPTGPARASGHRSLAGRSEGDKARRTHDDRQYLVRRFLVGEMPHAGESLDANETAERREGAH